jgi:8-amino-7-oxononanoate synthase
MAIFDKFQQIAETRRAIAESGVSSINVVMEQVISPTEAIINGRRTILAGTNNYLGLTFHPECVEAACQALRSEGTGTTGSRAANGNYRGHMELERELAEFLGYRSVIVFSTGYVANLGMIATLTGPGDVLLIDSDSHASIYDGSRLSGAEIIRFRHNDAAIVVVEGIYSMLGDRAPLADIAAVKRTHGAYLLVDEAHSLGVLGDHGRGLAEETGVEADVDFTIGTFSKSLGAIGGYCASNHPELDLIRYANRPWVFTASNSPSIVASTRKALVLLQAHPELRHRLWEHSRRLYGRLASLGFNLGPEPSPIIAVRLSAREQTLAMWCMLLERGVYVNWVVPPASPDGSSLLRCSISAGHTPEQIDAIGDAFADLQMAGGLA